VERGPQRPATQYGATQVIAQWRVSGQTNVPGEHRLTAMSADRLQEFHVLAEFDALGVGGDGGVDLRQGLTAGTSQVPR
jgi:hypothetical protein